MPPKKTTTGTTVKSAAKPVAKTTIKTTTAKATTAKATTAKTTTAKAKGKSKAVESASESISDSESVEIVESPKATKTTKAAAKAVAKATKATKAIKSVKSTDDSTETSINPKGQYILVIVESPGKIKKLESILGKGYMVKSSYGHIMDLHANKLSVDIENNFEPEYTIIKGKEKFKDKTEKWVKEKVKIDYNSLK